MIKVVFFGTHQFASVILQSMIDNPKINVSLVKIPVTNIFPEGSVEIENPVL